MYVQTEKLFSFAKNPARNVQDANFPTYECTGLYENELFISNHYLISELHIHRKARSIFSDRLVLFCLF